MKHLTIPVDTVLLKGFYFGILATLVLDTFTTPFKAIIRFDMAAVVVLAIAGIAFRAYMQKYERQEREQMRRHVTSEEIRQERTGQ